MLWQQVFSKNAQLREYYSGCGRLSTAIAQRGINVKAYEAFPKDLKLYKALRGPYKALIRKIRP